MRNARCGYALCAMRMRPAGMGHGPWAMGHAARAACGYVSSSPTSNIQPMRNQWWFASLGQSLCDFFPTGGGPGFPRLQKRCLEWRGVLKCKAFKQDEMQCKTEVADMPRNDLASYSASNNGSKWQSLCDFFPTGGGAGFPRLQKRCLEWRGVLKCKAFKQDEMQCKTEVADMLRNDLASYSASNNGSKFLLLGTRK